MMNLAVYDHLLKYNDWANRSILAASERLDEAQLETRFDIGMGSLRRTLIHIYNGEWVWMNRWQGRAETPWPDESERVTASSLRDRFDATVRERDTYLRTLNDQGLKEIVIYRDSKGSRFQAPRGDMLTQMFVHSTHHRAQAANILRQLGAGLVELDFMMSLRKPVS